MSITLSETLEDIYKVIKNNYRGKSSITEMLECNMLFNVLGELEYVEQSIMEEFDLSKAPNEVYIFDTSRKKFWKKGAHGYTYFISEAGLFDIDFAKSFCGAMSDNKIVYFE